MLASLPSEKNIGQGGYAPSYLASMYTYIIWKNILKYYGSTVQSSN